MAVTGFVKQKGSSGVRADLRARLDAYTHGECDGDALVADLKEVCKTNADAVWELLSLLDQYRRRGILTDEDFRQLKNAANYIAFGPPPEANKSTPARAHAASAPKSPTGTPPPSAANEWRLAEDLTEAELDDVTGTAAGIRHGFDGRHTSVTQTRTGTGPEREPVRPRGDAASAAPRHQPGHDTHQPASADPLQAGRVLHDRYTLERRLAAGRRSVVFRALDRFSVNEAARAVAVKILRADSPQAPAQFEHELRIGQQLAHPNIVKVFDLDRDDDLLFYSMELIEGTTLAELLRHSPPQRPRALALITQLADAVSYMHERGFAHGDLHPGNILVSAAGEVKLVDFGATAEPASVLPANVAVVVSASGFGYASCERLSRLPADLRDDVFSLSCIAYQLLGGAHPFHGQSALRARELRQSPAPLRDLTSRQWRCLHHGLAFRRERRPASVRDWLTAFNGDAPVLTLSPAAAALYAADHEVGARARITAGTRIGAPAPADSQSPAGHGPTWSVAMAICLLAVLAFAFLSVDLDSTAVPELAKTQASMRQAVNKSLHALRSLGGTTTEPAAVAAPPATQADSRSDESPDTAVMPGETPDTKPVQSDTLGAGPPTPAGATDSRARESAASGERAKSDDTGVGQVSPAHGKVTFAQDTFMVNKSDGAARIKIRREGGAAGKVSFVWWTEPGTAEVRKDFMPLGRKTETLADGERELTVFVPLVVGSDNRNRHVFFVELGDPSNGLRYGRISRARVIIMDD